MTANINLPRILRIGAGASRLLPEVLDELNLKQPLLVTDAFIVSLGWLDTLETQLSEKGFSHNRFTGVVPDPTSAAVTAGLAVLRQGEYDCVVALGGGSSIDTAKAIAVMAHRDQPMRHYKVPNSIDDGLPVIAIPTTAGTGSEATRAAVITDTDSQEKMLCMGLGLMPIAALVDFELTLSMPWRLTADTGLDSLCHALEAYVSKKANAFTDTIALAAMTAINTLAKRLQGTSAYMHSCMHVRQDYWEQVTAEVKAPSKRHRGKLLWQLRSGKRNEAGDCENYALHAAHAKGMHKLTDGKWSEIEARLGQKTLFSDTGEVTEAKPKRKRRTSTPVGSLLG